MSRFNDIIQSIRGGAEEEPKPRSGIDTVKDFLKAAAITTAAGAIGGEAGMRALGGYAQARTANREKRRLDKIARAKDELNAMTSIAAIEASEGANKRANENMERQKRLDFERKVRATELEQAGLRKFQAEQETKRQGNAVKMAQTMLSASGLGTSRKGSRSSSTGSSSVKDPKVPTVITPSALPPSPTEDQQKAFDATSGKNMDEIMKYAATVAQDFRRAGVSADEFAIEGWPIFSKDTAISGLRPEDQEKVRNAIVRELSAPEKLAAQAKMKAEGGLEVPAPQTTITEKIADTLPVVGPTVTGAATGLAFGGPVGTVVGGLAGYKAGQAMDPNKPMFDYLPGSQSARQVVSDVGQGLSSAGSGISEAGRSMKREIIDPISGAASSAKDAISSRIARLRQAMAEAAAQGKRNLRMR